MPDKDEKKKRAPPLSIRLPKDLEADFYAAAATSGQSVNAFAVDAIAGKVRRSRPRTDRAALQTLARLLAKAAQISDQLHEIALTGAADSALPIEQTRSELCEIRAALLTLMGRKP